MVRRRLSFFFHPGKISCNGNPGIGIAQPIIIFKTSAGCNDPAPLTPLFPIPGRVMKMPMVTGICPAWIRLSNTVGAFHTGNPSWFTYTQAVWPDRYCAGTYRVISLQVPKNFELAESKAEGKVRPRPSGFATKSQQDIFLPGFWAGFETQQSNNKTGIRNFIWLSLVKV